MRKTISLVAALALLPGVAFAQEGAQAKARAAALLQLHRLKQTEQRREEQERAHATASLMLASLTHILPAEKPDLVATAVRSAREDGALVFVWVGGCKELARDLFPEATNVHVDAYQNDKRPRLVLPQEDGDYVWFERDATPEAVTAFLHRLRLRRRPHEEAAPEVRPASGGGCEGGSWGGRGFSRFRR